MTNPTFTLRRYNPRRRARGVEAAEVQVADAYVSILLWMSPKDIQNNIALYGPVPGLLAAREAYKRNVEILDTAETTEPSE